MTQNGIYEWTDPEGDGIAVALTNSAGGGGTPDDNSVTTAKIADGAILNADINSGAAIAVSKLAAGTATYVVTSTAGTAVWAAPAGGAPSGSAGGSLTGTYPNPTIATIPSGATGTTQTAADNSTKIATTAYVDAKERAFLFGKAGAIGATETNAADFPFIVPFAATMKRGKVVLGAAATGAMTVQVRKASAPGTAVPSYADVTGFVMTFASGSQIATFTLGTATAVAEGDLLNFSAATGSGSNMMVEVVAT